jgi:hypothetical protein
MRSHVGYPARPKLIGQGARNSQNTQSDWSKDLNVIFLLARFTEPAGSPCSTARDAFLNI